MTPRPGKPLAITDILVRIIVAIVVIAFIVDIVRQSPSGAGASSVAGPSSARPGENFQPAFETFSDEDSSEGAAIPRRRVKIIVPAGLTHEQLDQTLRAAGQQVIDQEHPKGFMLFAYKKGTDTNIEYTAGRVTYGPDGDIARAGEDVPDSARTMKVDFADFYFQAQGYKPTPSGDPKLDKMFGPDLKALASVQQKLSEEKRRSLFYEIAEGEARASKQAEADFPTPEDMPQKEMLDQIGKRNQREEDLTNASHRKVGHQHNLTVAEIEAIRHEGMDQHWPMPDLQ